MDKLLPYLSFRGRANRQRYWLTNLALYGVFLAGLVLTGLIYSLVPVVGAILGVATVILALWASLAVSVRRLHDRGKSAWWLPLMLAPVFLLAAMRAIVSASDPAVGGLFALLSLPFSIWMFVELGCLKGTTGANRFGPDPLQPQLAEVFS